MAWGRGERKGKKTNANICEPTKEGEKQRIGQTTEEEMVKSEKGFRDYCESTMEKRRGTVAYQPRDARHQRDTDLSCLDVRRRRIEDVAG